MSKIKQWVNGLSVKKKLVFYGYLFITPVVLLICLVLLFSNYNKEINQRLENDVASVNTLTSSVDMLQTDIKDFSTYICINNEVHQLLTAKNVEQLNVDSQLWLEHAPMQIVQDMISLKGHIKTIAIYPENGIRPYLRGMDGSVYISDMNTLHGTEIYKQTIDSDNGMIWKSVPKGRGETYETNNTDKVVLYREIFDLTQKKTLGYIVIGVSAERFNTMCENVIQGKQESVLILDKNGGELCRAGNLDEKVEEYLKHDEFLKQDYNKRKTHFTYGDYDIICEQTDKNTSVVCKIVPKYGLQMQIMDIVYMPVTLLAGVLIALLPLLLVISNIVTKPLSVVREAIQKFSQGDFGQQVTVTTHDEVGEVAECFNQMVGSIRDLINKNYVITLQEKESELAALQAQINPHFLYNTLDSLYWQAQDAENEELAETILALSQLFRLVLNKGQGEVTVGQEIELISRYLQIQKVRFAKQLNYTIQV
ncbi:MAG: HAMP domain-containing protein, partial [Clostridia bacterium]|nr:HAMP domain-containing protein [Clostridia bacterium]